MPPLLSRFPAAASAAAPITLRLDPGNGAPAGGGHQDQIELQSYAFGAAIPASRVSKVDGFTVRQKAARGSAGVDLGSWAKAEGLEAAPSHKPRGSNQLAMDDTPGAEKSRSGPGNPYVLTGVGHRARLTVAGDYPTCRAGRRYPSATLHDGARVHRLRDLVVSECAGRTVTFTYTVTNSAP